MKSLLRVTAAVAALASLAACDMLGLNGDESTAGNNSTNSVASNAIDMNASAAAPGGKDPAAAGGNVATASAPFTGQVTTAFLVGRWTDNDDCTKTIEFRDDGNFITHEGATGMWTLNGDRLTFAGTRSVTAQVAAPNQDTIMLTHADGSVGRSTRCS